MSNERTNQATTQICTLDLDIIRINDIMEPIVKKIKKTSSVHDIRYCIQIDNYTVNYDDVAQEESSCSVDVTINLNNNVTIKRTICNFSDPSGIAKLLDYDILCAGTSCIEGNITFDPENPGWNIPMIDGIDLITVTSYWRNRKVKLILCD